MDYMPGDALSIMPKNAPGHVEELIHRMRWTEIADSLIDLVPSNPNSGPTDRQPPPIALLSNGGSLTLRELLSNHLDIMAVPRRSFFSKIAGYTSDVSQKERLLEFVQPQYLDEYADYATRARRSILEVLQEFESVRLPWQDAIHVFPALRPRRFSIASGGALKRTSIGRINFELLVAIVKYRTVIKKIREGVCTRYLAGLTEGSVLELELRTEGRFHSKHASLKGNHVLVGTGTGIAPLRSLIHEKQLVIDHDAATTLVFGSRRASSDFFFEHEWVAVKSSRLEDNQASLRVITAFSRDQKEKLYVQDRIREHANLLSDQICNRNATVIVCGSSGQMPKAVREALVDALVAGGASPEFRLLFGTRRDAEAHLERMEKQGRYKQETW